MRGIMRSFGEILASLREERGIYQKELAAILKVSVGTISNYENNIHFPDQEALIQLAEYFDVTIDYLLGRTPYRYNPEVLRQECVPGTTVSDVVEVIQHFNPKNMASLLDFVDLLQLREKDVRSLDEVDYAILETNGKLSVFQKQDDNLSLIHI